MSVYKDSGLGKWFGKGGKGGTTKGGWDRYNTKGEKIGKCGDAKEGEGYAACLSAEKARKLGKEGRASFVRRKRKAQSKAGDPKKGKGEKGETKKSKKPTYVKTGASKRKAKKMNENNIFSFGEYLTEKTKNVPTNPELWSRAKSAAKKKFDVYPSAYANAWASKWYKKRGGGWKKKKS